MPGSSYTPGGLPARARGQIPSTPQLPATQRCLHDELKLESKDSSQQNNILILPYGRFP